MNTIYIVSFKNDKFNVFEEEVEKITEKLIVFKRYTEIGKQIKKTDIEEIKHSYGDASLLVVNQEDIEEAKNKVLCSLINKEKEVIEISEKKIIVATQRIKFYKDNYK